MSTKLTHSFIYDGQAKPVFAIPFPAPAACTVEFRRNVFFRAMQKFTIIPVLSISMMIQRYNLTEWTFKYLQWRDMPLYIDGWVSCMGF